MYSINLSAFNPQLIFLTGFGRIMSKLCECDWIFYVEDWYSYYGSPER